MQCNSLGRNGLLKRKRKSSSSFSDIENEPYKDEKRIKFENTGTSTLLEESNSTLQVSESPSSADERVPLTELSLTNVTASTDTLPSDDSDRFFNDIELDGDFGNLILDMGQSVNNDTFTPDALIKNEPSTSKNNNDNILPSTSKICIHPKRFGTKSCPLPSLEWSEKSVLWRFMSKKDDESLKTRNPHYFTLHPSVQPKMRSVLLEWILEVCSVYKLQRETYFLAVDYLDRYLSLSSNVSKKQLQLIGVTCLFISSKFEEIYPPKLTEFAYITDGACVEADILTMEIKIVDLLNWRSITITPNSWLTIFLQLLHHSDGPESEFEVRFAKFPNQLFDSASQLIDLCTLDEGFLRYSYKSIAVSAVYICYSKNDTFLTSGLTLEEISPCVTWMTPFWLILQNDTEGVEKFVNDTSLGKVVNSKDVSKKSHVPWDAICKHNVNFILLEKVQILLKKQTDTESGLLTPPLSSKKNTD